MVNSFGQITSAELKSQDQDAFAASRSVSKFVYSDGTATSWRIGSSGYCIMALHDLVKMQEVTPGIYLSLSSFHFLADSEDTPPLVITGGQLR